MMQKEILKNEVLLLKRLRNLAVEKKNTLLQEDVEALARLVKEEERVLKDLEGIRLRESITEPAPELREMFEERRRLAAEIRELNLFNQQFIEDSLAYIHFFVQTLQGESGRNIYGCTGRVEAKPANALIDLKG